MTKNCYKIDKTDKQKEAVKLIAENETTLLEGGGRSGKTFIALYIIIVRCLLFPMSRHLIARFRFSHIKQAICYDTMPKVLEATGQKAVVRLNKSDWFYEFSNGSSIWVGGLDDKERTEKILGNEYATIFLNEASQISFQAYETIITRLNPPPGMNAKMIIDYNPPSIQHWGYKMFHKRKFPDGRQIPEGDFVKLLMNPKDNPHIDPGYLKRLSLLSEVKRKRFLEGQYSLDSGSLWKRAWIKYEEHPPEGMYRVVIGVDPAGTVDGDEIGIVVCGQYEENFYILDDFSLHGTPKTWAEEVAAAYKKWGADLVVAEKNYGGDMVKSTIENALKYINVELVNSSRGKIVRAEPISALYEQGLVYHRTQFNDLEDEMCIYEPDGTQSPNRMDAMVFAMTELTGEGVSMLDVI
jgi:phage terminase large subunit-like protein